VPIVIWFLLRWTIGAGIGIALLRVFDEKRFDDALLSGAWIPPPTPEARFRFLVLCTLVPEIPIAGILATVCAKRM
jgi:hypothetical protein